MPCGQTDTNITVSMGKYTPTNPIQHSGYVPLAKRSPPFFVLSPLQNIVTSLSFPSSSSFPVSLLCPLLLDLHVAFLLSGCENLLWQERQREGHGWVSRQHTASRAASEAGRQAASVFLWKAAFHVLPCFAALNKEHKEVYSITQEDNAANVNSDPGSPPFSCVCLSHSLSSSLLPCLSLLHFSSTALSL